MRPIGRVGVDSAGGLLLVLGNLVPGITINGAPIAVINDPVTPHGDGPHAGPVMAEGNTGITANGIPVCFNGDLASCAHPLVSDSTVTGT